MQFGTNIYGNAFLDKNVKQNRMDQKREFSLRRSFEHD